MMRNKFASLLCLCTVFVVGLLIFFNNKTVDYPTILFALKTIIPAGIVAYLGGYYIGKILETSKVDTDVIKVDAQKLFIDDLLLTPDEVVNNVREASSIPSTAAMTEKTNKTTTEDTTSREK